MGQSAGVGSLAVLVRGGRRRSAAVLWLLNDILLPFVVGMVVAYFLDPVVVRLQRARLSRTMATTVVTIVAVLAAIGIVMAILPPLFGQIQTLITSAPEYIVKAIGPDPAADRTAAKPAGTRSAQRSRPAGGSDPVGRQGARLRRRPRRRRGRARCGDHQPARPAFHHAGRDVLPAARLGEGDGRDRQRPAARPCRHDPQARARIERRHRGLHARPGAGLPLPSARSMASASRWWACSSAWSSA